jgi:hypothetical protein
VAQHNYPEGEEPDVEVELDGIWHPGKLHGWTDDGEQRLMDVAWRTDLGTDFLDTVPAQRVRGIALKPTLHPREDTP